MKKQIRAMVLPTMLFFLPENILNRSDIELSVQYIRSSETEINANVWISIGESNSRHFLRTGTLPFDQDDEKQCNIILNAILNNDDFIECISQFVTEYEKLKLESYRKPKRDRWLPPQ